MEQVNEVFANPKFDVKLPNVLYVHGYLDSPFTASSRSVIDAYFKLGGVNVLALDWSSLAGNTYANAVTSAKVVSALKMVSNN